MPAGGRKKSGTPSKARTNLELFVLAAVCAGLSTAYDLKKNAELSVGATIPLLVKLTKLGLLEATSAPRRSRRYSLTPQGIKALRKEWQRMLAPVPLNFEDILRSAYLAAAMESDVRTIRKFLRDSARQRKHLAAVRGEDARSFPATPSPRSFGTGYRWLRAFSDASRLRAEATMLSRAARHKDLAKLLRPV